MKSIKVFIVGLVVLSACNSVSKEKPVLVSDSTKEADCVFLTSDEKDQPVISWCEADGKTDKKNFYMAWFDESSGSFSSRIPVPIEQNANFHEEGMPKLAIKGDGTIIAVYETSAPTDSNKYAGFVHYIVSADKGKTWTTPVCLHADTVAGKSHSFAAITRLSDGEIGACWLDESFDRRAGGRPVKFAKTNHDNRFENELIIDSVACQCCRIAMSSSAGGKLTVAFRDIIKDSIRDMSVSSSNDNGKSFSPAMPFSKDGWVINGCPHNGPSVATSDKNIYAAWFTGGPQKGVYYCEMNDNKETVIKQLVSDHGRFIQLCLLSDGTRVLAYNENVQEGDKTYNRIVLNKIEHDKIFASGDISAERSMASYPVIRAFEPGKIIVAWTSNEKIYYTIKSISSINTPIQRSTANVATAENDLSRIKLASSKDLVCGMALSMSPGDTMQFKGRVYGFCSDICKSAFMRDPESFAGK